MSRVYLASSCDPRKEDSPDFCTLCGLDFNILQKERSCFPLCSWKYLYSRQNSNKDIWTCSAENRWRWRLSYSRQMQTSLRRPSGGGWKWRLAHEPPLEFCAPNVESYNLHTLLPCLKNLPPTPSWGPNAVEWSVSRRAAGTIRSLPDATIFLLLPFPSSSTYRRSCFVPMHPIPTLVLSTTDLLCSYGAPSFAMLQILSQTVSIHMYIPTDVIGFWIYYEYRIIVLATFASAGFVVNEHGYYTIILTSHEAQKYKEHIANCFIRWSYESSTKFDVSFFWYW